MKSNSPKQIVSWVAAIALILAYLIFFNPLISNIGVVQAKSVESLPAVSTVAEVANSSSGYLTIHTWAGTLIVGNASSAIAQGAELGQAVYRLGPIYFVPAES